MVKPAKCKPVMENVMECSWCGGTVDRFPGAFQCRDCGALGSLEGEESDG